VIYVDEVQYSLPRLFDLVPQGCNSNLMRCAEPWFSALRKDTKYDWNISSYPYPSKVAIGLDLVIQHMSIRRGFITFKPKKSRSGQKLGNSGSYRFRQLIGLKHSSLSWQKWKVLVANIIFQNCAKLAKIWLHLNLRSEGVQKISHWKIPFIGYHIPPGVLKSQKLPSSDNSHFNKK